MGMGGFLLAILCYLLSVYWVLLGEVDMITIGTLFSGVPPILRTRLVVIEVYVDHQSFASWTVRIIPHVSNIPSTSPTKDHFVG